ncbi:MAG: SpoIIE family protein phosphatase [Brevinematales bacterium]|nr:SpoIIE family protein phosphatase [Brevinematales bacterium]
MSTASLTLIIAGAIILGLAIDIILRGTRKLNIAASVFLGLTALVVASEGIKGYLLSVARAGLASAIIRAEFAFIILLASSFYLFTNHFPRGEYWKTKRGFMYSLIAVAAVFVIISMLGLDRSSTSYIMVFDNGQYVPEVLIDYNLLHYIIAAGIVGIVLYSLYLILAKIKRVRLMYQKQQIRYFLTASVTFGFIWFLTLLFRNELPPTVKYIMIAAGSVVFASVTFYTIVVYRFGSLRKTVSRLASEFAVSLILIVPVAAVLFMVRSWINDLSPALFFLLITPSIAVIFRIVELAYLLIRQILGGDTGGTDVTERIINRLWNARNYEELAFRTVTLLEELIECGNADFLIYDAKEKAFRVQFSSMNNDYTVPGDDPLFQQFEKDAEFYHRDMVNIDPRYHAIKDNAEKYFAGHRFQILIPIFFESEIPALIHISQKLDENSYTNPELGMIRKIGKIVTIAMNNMILFQKEENAKSTLRDLNLAMQIQESVFQHDIPKFAKMDVYMFQQPAKWVSGDYYMVEKTPDEGAGMIIADVSGKGIPAALVAMLIHTVVKTQEFTRTSVGSIVKKINEVMTQNQSMSGFTRISSFATLFCGYIDCGSNTLYYNNAGHMPMLIFDRAKSRFEYLPPNSKPVGLFPEFEYPTAVKKLARNRILTLFSDGITEAINLKDEEFGQERLEAVISENEGKAAREIATRIIDEVTRFTQGREQFDDITLIVIKL